MNDLVTLAKKVGATALDDEAKRTILATLPEAARAYIKDFTGRSGPREVATRVDFALAPTWRDEFGPNLTNIPSFDAYTKMNAAVPETTNDCKELARRK